MNDFDLSNATNWHPEPAANPHQIEGLHAGYQLNLPEDYLGFLKFSNGGEGNLGVEPGWFFLWPAQEVVRLNQDYKV